jgi:hypothetical protein
VSSRPGDATRAGSAWHATVRWRSRRARAARHLRANTSPHEPYDRFREKLQQTQLRRAASRMPNAAAPQAPSSAARDAAGSSSLLVAARQGHHVYIELEHELHEGSALFLCGRTQRPSSVGALVAFNPCPKLSHARPCRQLSQSLEVSLRDCSTMFRRVDRPAAGLRELIRARRFLPPPGRYPLVVHGDYRSCRLANERETSASNEKPVRHILKEIGCVV